MVSLEKPPACCAPAWVQVRLLLLDGASPDDVLLALLHGALLQRELGHGRTAEEGALARAAGDIAGEGRLELVRRTLDAARVEMGVFGQAVRAAGWDVDSASHAEDEVSRLVFEDHPPHTHSAAA